MGIEKQEVMVEGIKSTPAIMGAAYSTLTLNEWVAAATLIYIVVQCGILVHKHYYFVKEKKAQKNENNQ